MYSGYVPNPTQGRSRLGSIIKNCDNTQVLCSNSDTKFIPDSSEYTKYTKQKSYNRNYNDVSNGGYNNAS